MAGRGRAVDADQRQYRSLTVPYISNITIMGHAGNGAECREVGDTTCTTVNVAVNTRYKEKGGDWKDRTTWWRVSVWGKQGEWLARDCRKGSVIVASGEAEVREYTDKDGKPRWSAEIRATSCRVVGGKEAAPAADAPRAPTRPAATSGHATLDDGPPF